MDIDLGERERRLGFFDRGASWWDDVYTHDTLAGDVYRARERRILAWVGDLGLAPGASIFEVGCGAARLASALGERGFEVDAIDACSAMVRHARKHVADAGLGDRVRVEVGDAESLPGESESFDLVVAVGVLPWVESPVRLVHECARLLRPGGAVILTADNASRLGALGEPGAHPIFSPIREARRDWRKRRGVRMGPRWRMHYPAQVDSLLADAGLLVGRRSTVGFGPFTVRSRKILGEDRGRHLDQMLNGLAAERLPFLRRRGWHYVVLAHRPESEIGESR
jgi:SAM-dependent methyltransferase